MRKKQARDRSESRRPTSGQLPPGTYSAVLFGAHMTESKQKQTPGWKLTFEITSGPFAGRKISETLYIIDRDSFKERLIIFGHRLGLLERKKDGNGYALADGKINFMDCVGTQCVIKVIHTAYGTDPIKNHCQISYAGIWQVKHVHQNALATINEALAAITKLAEMRENLRRLPSQQRNEIAGKLVALATRLGMEAEHAIDG